MMKKKIESPLINCIALYDWTPESTDLKGWFHYMEEWAYEINMPWESIGITTSRKLIQFKNGRRKLIKTNFDKIEDIELMGGVDEPGTNVNWKIYSAFTQQKRDCRNSTELCFADNLAPFTSQILTGFLQKLLSFADFKYGICYQRPYHLGPSLYAGGALMNSDLITEVESDQIWFWSKKYIFNDGRYRTGLLRDVYPFSILVDQHLCESVGNKSFKEWVESDPTHGSLTKITANHYLWAVDPIHIPLVQEILQEAGLLLCYKV